MGYETGRRSFLKSMFAVPLAYKTFSDDGKITENLREIHNEVRAMNKRNGDGFIQLDFDRDLFKNGYNNEEHVIVFGYGVWEAEITGIDVTYFKDTKSNIKLPEISRYIVFEKRGDEIEIKKNDYESDELKKLLPEILKGIRREKKLLRSVNPFSGNRRAFFEYVLPSCL